VNDYGAYSIITTTDLFHDEACRQIEREHQTQQRRLA
jgi:hypothetical protein